MGNDRDCAALASGLAVGLGVVTLVGDHRARRHLRADLKQGLELATVGRLVAGQMEIEREAVEVTLEVDLAAETAARAAERLALLPPFAPAAETCARTEVLSKN